MAASVGLFFYWLFLLAMVLLVPGTMLFFGRELEKNPPKEINGGYGYRTNRSMKSKLAWDFAQVYCGRLWQKCGKILLPVSVVPMLFVLGQDVEPASIVCLAVTAVQMIVLIGTLFPTEAALKKNFDKNGLPYSQ